MDYCWYMIDMPLKSSDFEDVGKEEESFSKTGYGFGQ